MKEKIINQSYTYELPGLDVTLTIFKNPFEISVHDLFSMAVRNNPKRRFLFVSKVLGKHIPVKPHVALSIGVLLSRLYAKECYGFDDNKSYKLSSLITDESNGRAVLEEFLNEKIVLPEKNLFLAFAETATALGHTAFSVFSSEAYFIHTTREDVKNIEPLLNFEEEHSHAVEHRIFPLQSSVFLSKCPMVIIDDEITTGKSVLNLIEQLHRFYPRQKYTILSILDWRNSDSISMFKEYEERLGVKIEVVSLLSGTIKFDFKRVVPCDDFVNDVTKKDIKREINDKTSDEISDDIRGDSKGGTNDKLNHLTKGAKRALVNCRKFYIDGFEKVNESKGSFLKWTGRFGLTGDEMKLLDNSIRENAIILKQMRKSSKTLCLGYTEFMYIPMLLAHYMGEGINFHSVTQSPIFPYAQKKYAIQNAYKFSDFYFLDRNEPSLKNESSEQNEFSLRNECSDQNEPSLRNESREQNEFSLRNECSEQYEPSLRSESSLRNDSSSNNASVAKKECISNSNTQRYLYNIPLDRYQEVFIFMERDIEDSQVQKIKTIFEKTSIKEIVVVIF